MKLVTVILVCLLFQSTATIINAQNFYNTWYYNYDLVWEGSAGAGLMNCLTDVGGSKGRGAKFLKDINWNCTKPSINLYFGATYKDFLCVRLGWQSGSVHGADSLLRNDDPDPAGRYGRNLSFKSSVREFSLLAETHPLFWNIRPQDKVPSLSPYFLAGFAYYHFNPQARLAEAWYDLHQLHLEGQGFPEPGMAKPYKLNQFAVPVGLGLRYETGPLFNLRFDCIYRLLFTDYLDDISTSYIDPSYFDKYLTTSQAALARKLYQRMDELRPGFSPPNGSQRGNPKDRDAYFSFQFSLCYVFRHRIK